MSSFQVINFLFPTCHEFISGFFLVIIFRIKNLSGSSFFFPFKFSFFLISQLLSLWLFQSEFFFSFLNKKWFTFIIPRCWENVPKWKEFLNLEGWYSSTCHPVLDSWNVEYNLSLEIDSMSWAPVANVLNVSTEDIFSVGCDNDPPSSIKYIPERMIFPTVILKSDW